jgi:hypothetical protein
MFFLNFGRSPENLFVFFLYLIQKKKCFARASFFELFQYYLSWLTFVKILVLFI